MRGGWGPGRERATVRPTRSSVCAPGGSEEPGEPPGSPGLEAAGRTRAAWIPDPPGPTLRSSFSGITAQAPVLLGEPLARALCLGVCAGPPAPGAPSQHQGSRLVRAGLDRSLSSAHRWGAGGLIQGWGPVALKRAPPPGMGAQPPGAVAQSALVSAEADAGPSAATPRAGAWLTSWRLRKINSADEADEKAVKGCRGDGG